VAWNTTVQIGGRAVGLVASITFNAILVRHLGIATYGQFVAASTYVGLFMILGEAGLYLVSVRRAMQEPARRAQVLGTALGLRLLWSIVPLSIAFGVAQIIPEERFHIYDRSVKLTIGILALNEYVRLLCQFLTAVFRMHLRMELSVIGEVGSRVVALLGILLVVDRDGGLRSVAAALTIANVANLAYHWLMSQRLERFRPQLQAELVKQMVREAVVVAGVLVMSLLRTQIGIFLLSLQRASEDVGIYGVATKVHDVVITFPGMFAAILFPVLSRLASEDDARLRRLFQRTFDVMILAGVGLSLTVVVLAPQFASILGEPRAAAPMRLLALAYPSIFLGMSFAHLVLALGRQAILLRLYTLLAVATFIINALLIPRFSYWSVAVASVSMETLVLVSLAAYSIKLRRVQPGGRALWCAPVALVLGVALLGLAGRWLVPEAATIPQRLVIVAIGGTATLGLYVAAVSGFKIVDPEVLRAVLPERAPKNTDAPEI
jgi:O-antigen/teichoic acid export membrane protein